MQQEQLPNPPPPPNTTINNQARESTNPRDKINGYYASLRKGIYLIQSNQLIQFFCKSIKVQHILEIVQTPINYVDLKQFKNVMECRASICNLIDLYVDNMIKNEDQKKLVEEMQKFYDGTISDVLQKRLKTSQEAYQNIESLQARREQFMRNKIYRLNEPYINSTDMNQVQGLGQSFSNINNLYNLLTQPQILKKDLSESQVNMLLEGVQKTQLVKAINDFQKQCLSTLQQLSEHQNTQPLLQKFKTEQNNAFVKNVQNLQRTINNYVNPCNRMNLLIQQNRVMRNFESFKRSNLRFFLSNILRKMPIFINVLKQIKNEELLEQQLMEQQIEQDPENPNIDLQTIDQFQEVVQQRIQECTQLNPQEAVVVGLKIQGFSPDIPMQMHCMLYYLQILKEYRARLTADLQNVNFFDVLRDLGFKFPHTFEILIGIQIEFQQSYYAIDFINVFNTIYSQHEHQSQFKWSLVPNSAKLVSQRPMYSDNLASSNLFNVMCKSQHGEDYEYFSSANYSNQQKLNRANTVKEQVTQKVRNLDLSKGFDQESFANVMTQFLSSSQAPQILRTYDQYMRFKQQYNQFQVFNTSEISYKNTFSPRELDYLNCEQNFLNIQMFPVIAKVPNIQYDKSLVDVQYEGLFFAQYEGLEIKPQIHFKQQICNLNQCLRLINQQLIEITQKEFDNQYAIDNQQQVRELKKLKALSRQHDALDREQVNVRHMSAKAIHNRQMIKGWGK